MLLHVLTEKGHGVPQASDDPVTYHTPPVFEKVGPDRTILSLKRGGAGPTPTPSATRIHEAMQDEPARHRHDGGHVPGQQAGEGARRTSPTASSTSASANRTPSPSPPAWPRPACGRSSTSIRTFLQRSFDQIFQEVALQNLPVVFSLDRAGLTGPDGPTHHGVFDIAYMRLFPNMVVMAPGDELRRGADAATSPWHTTARRRCAIPRRTWKRSSARGADGTGPGRSHRVGRATAMLVAFGTLFPTCVKAARDAARRRG